MSTIEQLGAYEMHIEDLLRAIIARKEELDSAQDLDDFQKGRQLAYWEVIDMIRTRHQMILALLEEDNHAWD